MEFPALPPRLDGNAYSGNVHTAYQTVLDAYRRAVVVASLQNPEPTQVQIHLDIIEINILPVFTALDNGSAEEGIPRTWVGEAALCFADVIRNLDATLQHAQGRYVASFLFTLLQWPLMIK